MKRLVLQNGPIILSQVPESHNCNTQSFRPVHLSSYECSEPLDGFCFPQVQVWILSDWDNYPRHICARFTLDIRLSTFGIEYHRVWHNQLVAWQPWHLSFSFL